MDGAILDFAQIVSGKKGKAADLLTVFSRKMVVDPLFKERFSSHGLAHFYEFIAEVYKEEDKNPLLTVEMAHAAILSGLGCRILASLLNNTVFIVDFTYYIITAGHLDNERILEFLEFPELKEYNLNHPKRVDILGRLMKASNYQEVMPRLSRLYGPFSNKDWIKSLDFAQAIKHDVRRMHFVHNFVLSQLKYDKSDHSLIGYDLGLNENKITYRVRYTYDSLLKRCSYYSHKEFTRLLKYHMFWDDKEDSAAKLILAFELEDTFMQALRIIEVLKIGAGNRGQKKWLSRDTPPSSFARLASCISGLYDKAFYSDKEIWSMKGSIYGYIEQWPESRKVEFILALYLSSKDHGMELLGHFEWLRALVFKHGKGIYSSKYLQTFKDYKDHVDGLVSWVAEETGLSCDVIEFCVFPHLL